MTEINSHRTFGSLASVIYEILCMTNPENWFQNALISIAGGTIRFIFGRTSYNKRYQQFYVWMQPSSTKPDSFLANHTWFLVSCQS